MRSTMYNVPCTSDMMKSSHIPFALSICPFAKLRDEEVILVYHVHDVEKEKK